MPALSAVEILRRLERGKPDHMQVALDNQRRKEERREQFLRVLAGRHAQRWNLSADVARKHIDAVSVTSRRAVRESLGLD